MGAFDRANASFARRTRNTVAPFPEINAEAIGLVFRLMCGRASDALFPNPIIDEGAELQTRASRGKFGELYGFALRELSRSIDRARLEGEWTTYPQGSDPAILERSLAGKMTGWCTATGAAPQHLAAGDFYVYSTIDGKGELSIPRVAIRMENGKVAEMRGIGPSQEIEPKLLEMACEKGRSLPGYSRFETATDHMRRMASLYGKCFEPHGNENRYKSPDLKKDELQFLYEVKEEIRGFGDERDPRIDEVLAFRDQIGDYATMFDCERSQVVIDKRNFSATTRVFLGDLTADDYQLLENHPGPLVIRGNTSMDYAPITRLPPGIKFLGHASFSHCQKLESIPSRSFFKGWAEFDYSAVHQLGSGSVFSSNASFEGCPFKTLGPDVWFLGPVCFVNCRQLEAVYEGVTFRVSAYFRGSTKLRHIDSSIRFPDSSDILTLFDLVGDGRKSWIPRAGVY